MKETSWCISRSARGRRFRLGIFRRDRNRNDGSGAGGGKYGGAEAVGRVVGDCGEDGGDSLRGGNSQAGTAVCYRVRRSGGRCAGETSENTVYCFHRFEGRGFDYQRSGGEAAAGTVVDQAGSPGDG